MPMPPKKAAKVDPLDELESEAAGDLIAAMKSGDKDGVKSALRDFFSACMGREEAGEYKKG